MQISHLRNILIFPMRGGPPPDQPPYERDPGDPYIFYLPWVECRHRKSGKAGCCGNIPEKRDQAIIDNVATCSLLNELTDRVRCRICKLQER